MRFGGVKGDWFYCGVIMGISKMIDCVCQTVWLVKSRKIDRRQASYLAYYYFYLNTKPIHSCVFWHCHC
jgi:hypothetical protein